jgi:ABC-2 type transport system permease protein
VSATTLAQLTVLARRSMLQTLRTPFQIFPILFFPGMLLAVNSSGLASATKIPGFPANNYITFALAVTFMQGSIFALINAGTNVAGDLESGFFDRLALTPLKAPALLGGMLAGISVVGALQSIAYILMGVIGGAYFTTGFAGVLVIIAIGTLAAVGFGALGLAIGLRTGSGETVQGIFPLFFVLLFLSSSNLPRDLIQIGWFHAIATINPVSYLIEGIRALMVVGWDWSAILGSFAVAIGVVLLGLLLSTLALRGRMERT